VIRPQTRKAFALLIMILCLGHPVVAAAEEKITPGFREALAEFLTSQNMTAVVGDQITFAISQQALGEMAGNGVQLTETIQTVVVDAARASFGSRFKEVSGLVDLYAPLYAEHYSEKELRELSAFWTSPIGQKTMKTLPKLSEGSYKLLMEASTPYFPEFQTAVEKGFSEAGLNFGP
jgi:hypothetical protein